MEKIELKNIQHKVNNSNIICSFLCSDGSLIKEKYIGYSLSSAKRTFFNKYKNIF
jgi:hypothetical protein